RYTSCGKVVSDEMVSWLESLRAVVAALGARRPPLTVRATPVAPAQQSGSSKSVRPSPSSSMQLPQISVGARHSALSLGVCVHTLVAQTASVQASLSGVRVVPSGGWCGWQVPEPLHEESLQVVSVRSPHGAPSAAMLAWQVPAPSHVSARSQVLSAVLPQGVAGAARVARPPPAPAPGAGGVDPAALRSPPAGAAA